MDSSKIALIIVDMQYDFVENGSLAVPHSMSIIPIINLLIKKVKSQNGVIITTQDWHPPDHVSFISNYPDKQLYDSVDIDYDGYTLPQVIWPIHCVQGSHGADIVKDINQEDVDYRVKKGMNRSIDSYSAFADNHYMEFTTLTKILYQNYVDTVYVVGLAADYCVKMTALDAIKFGFQTYIVVDATKPVDKDRFESDLKGLRTKGIRMITYEDILMM